jgi:GntR family transcriptional regulator
MNSGTESEAVPNSEWPYTSIDRDSPIPYYYQLQEILKQNIEGGTWLPGELLPSEAEMAATLGISRTVIRKALDVLESDGQVYRVGGKGTVVAPPKFRYEAVRAAKQWFSHDLEGQIVLSELLHTSVVFAGGYLSRLLQLAAKDHVWEIVFRSDSSSQPVSLSQMYLRTDSSEALRTTHLQGISPVLGEKGPDIFDQLEAKYGLAIRETAITIQHAVANEFEGEQLGIRQGTPVLLLSQLSITDCAMPVAFTRTVVRSDLFHFSVTIQHPASGVMSEKGLLVDEEN